ncbi:MAG: aromatic amino acid hydroxylase [Halieaceae bacterium]
MTETIPAHLHQFIAEQDYDTRYTPRDQAVWRYAMRQLVAQLRDTAHPVYFDGLARTGVSVEHIPSIDEMNQCLAELGWRAVVVDGFIPPQAFMELQQNRILAIALDMRSIDHILYTPAPDIIHESAGHAPIIADEEYSDYLQRFGEVGVKAMYNRHDIELYEAIRQLSIIKECPQSTAQEIAAAEAELQRCSDDDSAPSEMALLGRLHWWTVEYGLVGEPEDYQLFGAGLLSSLGESASCLSDEVRKRPLTTEAILTPYDITREQPQLFVTKSCRHLTQILDEFAETMCFSRGGAEAVQTAIDAEVVTSCEFSSGLQVSGLFNRLMVNALGREIYIGSSGPTQLAYCDSELEGHGVSYHSEGFGSPVGRVCNLMKPLEDASEYELQALGILRHERVCLDFVSGVRVDGILQSITKQDHRLLLMSFSECTVTGPEGELLFDPAWGAYDMAVGEHISSVYPGAADRGRLDVYPPASREKTRHVEWSEQDQAEFALYQRLRDAREGGGVRESDLEEIRAEVQAQAPAAWLLLIELLELAPANSALAAALRQQLTALSGQQDEWHILIERGIKLLDNPSLAA